MQRCNFAQRHGQQLGREIECQFPVAFDGLGSEFLFRMLAKELSEQHRERSRKRRGDCTGTRLCQLVLLEFLGTAFRLGVNCLLFAGEAHLFNQPAVLAGGTRRTEEVTPDYFSGLVLALEDGHQLTTSTSGGG